MGRLFRGPFFPVPACFGFQPKVQPENLAFSVPCGGGRLAAGKPYATVLSYNYR